MDEEKKQRLRAQALPLTCLTEAMRKTAVKHGDLSLYRSAKQSRAELEEAGALLPKPSKTPE